MLANMTRSKLIQIWFTAVALMVVAGSAFGATVTVGTGTILAVLGVVPPAIVLAAVRRRLLRCFAVLMGGR